MVKNRNPKIPNNMVDQISRTAIEMWEKNKKKSEQEKKDNRLFNTKLLVLNYRKLKLHCEEEIPGDILIAGIAFDDERLSLDTLLNEKAKTYRMMQYVDSMLVAYAVYAKEKGDHIERRYKIMDRLYINKNLIKPSDLAELFNISDRQVYKDRDQAIRDFSVMLFGMSVIDFV